MAESRQLAIVPEKMPLGTKVRPRNPPGLGVGGINGVESGPFELQELTKSPYKMYERNPHTKCMRVVLSAEVKSAEAISKKSKIQEKSHASPRTTSSGAARAAPGGATRDDKQLFYGSNDLLWRLVVILLPYR